MKQEWHALRTRFYRPEAVVAHAAAGVPHSRQIFVTPDLFAPAPFWEAYLDVLNDIIWFGSKHTDEVVPDADVIDFLAARAAEPAEPAEAAEAADAGNAAFMASVIPPGAAMRAYALDAMDVGAAETAVGAAAAAAAPAPAPAPAPASPLLPANATDMALVGRDIILLQVARAMHKQVRECRSFSKFDWQPDYTDEWNLLLIAGVPLALVEDAAATRFWQDTSKRIFDQIGVVAGVGVGVGAGAGVGAGVGAGAGADLRTADLRTARALVPALINGVPLAQWWTGYHRVTALFLRDNVHVAPCAPYPLHATDAAQLMFRHEQNLLASCLQYVYARDTTLWSLAFPPYFWVANLFPRLVHSAIEFVKFGWRSLSLDDTGTCSWTPEEGKPPYAHTPFTQDMLRWAHDAQVAEGLVHYEEGLPMFRRKTAAVYPDLAFELWGPPGKTTQDLFALVQVVLQTFAGSGSLPRAVNHAAKTLRTILSHPSVEPTWIVALPFCVPLPGSAISSEAQTVCNALLDALRQRCGGLMRLTLPAVEGLLRTWPSRPVPPFSSHPYQAVVDPAIVRELMPFRDMFQEAFEAETAKEEAASMQRARYQDKSLRKLTASASALGSREWPDTLYDFALKRFLASRVYWRALTHSEARSLVTDSSMFSVGWRPVDLDMIRVLYAKDKRTLSSLESWRLSSTVLSVTETHVLLHFLQQKMHDFRTLQLSRWRPDIHVYQCLTARIFGLLVQADWQVRKFGKPDHACTACSSSWLFRKQDYAFAWCIPDTSRYAMNPYRLDADIPSVWTLASVNINACAMLVPADTWLAPPGCLHSFVAHLCDHVTITSKIYGERGEQPTDPHALAVHVWSTIAVAIALCGSARELVRLAGFWVFPDKKLLPEFRKLCMKHWPMNQQSNHPASILARACHAEYMASQSGAAAVGLAAGGAAAGGLAAGGLAAAGDPMQAPVFWQDALMGWPVDMPVGNPGITWMQHMHPEPGADYRSLRKIKSHIMTESSAETFAAKQHEQLYTTMTMQDNQYDVLYATMSALCTAQLAQQLDVVGIAARLHTGVPLQEEELLL
jgi:hypothetical protein